MPIEGLYALTPEQPDEAILAAQVEVALGAGLRLLQVRSKLGRDLRVQQTKRLVSLCRRYGATCIVNDDPALAAEVGADGVHLGREDGTVAEARRLLGAGAIVGVSCYDDLIRAQRLRAEGADYVAFGSFFPSSVKPNAVRPPLDLLTHARTVLDCPIVAIGGITLDTAPLVRDAGADAIAVITDVFSATDVGARVRAYGRLFERAVHPE
ncbi:MAG: thiamine phosphate synthase [Burkholderiales bacterium]|nr:thiamine phosphate synthase [Burkholderiales bacterium]